MFTLGGCLLIFNSACLKILSLSGHIRLAHSCHNTLFRDEFLAIYLGNQCLLYDNLVVRSKQLPIPSYSFNVWSSRNGVSNAPLSMVSWSSLERLFISFSYISLAQLSFLFLSRLSFAFASISNLCLFQALRAPSFVL